MSKLPRTTAFLFFALLSSAFCDPQPGVERMWTGMNGKTFLGVFARTYEDGGKKAQFLSATGKIVIVAFENLSLKDREIILAFEGKLPATPTPGEKSIPGDFKELPIANRKLIPDVKPEDFGGTDDESLVDALWISLLWWDAAGIVPIPKDGSFDRKAEWLHKELSRAVAKGGRSAATFEDAQEGMAGYFAKRLEKAATCQFSSLDDLSPAELAAKATGHDAVILSMTMTYSNGRDFVADSVIESIEADGTFAMHLFGERFTGKITPTSERNPANPGKLAFEIILNERNKMPEHYRTQGARFFIGDKSWNGTLVIKPLVFKAPPEK